MANFIVIVGVRLLILFCLLAFSFVLSCFGADRVAPKQSQLPALDLEAATPTLRLFPFLPEPVWGLAYDDVNSKGSYYVVTRFSRVYVKIGC